MTTSARRCLTLPLYLAGATLVPLLLLALPIAASVDLARRSDWAAVRTLLFVATYVLCEAIGIIAATLLWVGYGLRRSTHTSAYLDANFRLQCWWAGTLFAGIERIFRIRSEVSGGEVVAGGPLIVFSRHASTGDTILPAVLISAAHDMMLRYVLKKELLWDPCLDIVGNRLRNYFVDRRSTSPTREVEEVARLADDLGEREGVLIFPEGTRFSEAKRRRALRDLEGRVEPDLFEKATAMRNVLPPKLGGPVALLQRNLRTDLLVLAHTGFEGVEKMTDLLNGALIGRVIRVRFWRYPRTEIPSDPQALRRWLFDVWKSVDDWLEQMRDEPEAGVAGRQTCPS